MWCYTPISRKLLLTLWISVIAVKIAAHPALPFSKLSGLNSQVAYVDINTVYSLKRNYNQFNGPGTNVKLFRFADLYETALTPENAGRWENGANGKIWRIGISSAGAYSLYISFKSLQLVKGVCMYVYNEQGSCMYGPFTTEKLPPAGAFSVPPVHGDKIIIELNVPHNLNEYGHLIINKLYHDRLNCFGLAHKAYLLPPTLCDENVNCENGMFWQTEKRAVCKIVTDGALCSGTLVANTAHSREPYLLTAYHIIFDQKHAEQAIFFFNEEYAGCNAAAVQNSQSISGASLIATAPGLDHALLKLNQVPPESWRPYYAGWDVGARLPQLPVAAIHHPGGAPKQLAMSFRFLSSATYELSYRQDAFWRVNWEVGMTSPGSSGCPLFNKQHRLVGTLTGGNAACGRQGSDYFNKLSVAWSAPDVSGTTLMKWLDPLNSGVSELDGYDPYGFNLSDCNVAWNISAAEPLENVASFLPRAAAPGDRITGLAEKFLLSGSLRLPSVYLNVSQCLPGSAADYINICVWQGDNRPTLMIYKQKLALNRLANGINQVVLDSVLHIQGNFFIGYEPVLSSGASFALFRAASRGNDGVSGMFVYDQAWYAVNSLQKDYTTSLAIGISECYGRITRPGSASLKVYPNPCQDYLYFELPDARIPDDVRCFDMLGRAVSIRYLPGARHAVHFSLPRGTYILQVRCGDQKFQSGILVGKL